jgi:broad specificity phosphatase PhoE
MGDAPARVVLVRHGETEWSLQRRHTGRSDIPLDETGRDKAEALRPALATMPGIDTATVLTSPLQRARATAELAGFGSRAEVCADLLEWDYGVFEGRTTEDIRKEIPGWSVFTADITGGESVDQVGARADRLIADAVARGGLTLMFAHAHILRVTGARWCELPPVDGSRFTLEAASISVLGHEREARVIEHWNELPWRGVASSR